MSTRNKAILFLIIANIIWGAASPIFKWSLQNIPPWTLAFLRFSLATLIIFPFTYNRLSIHRKDLLKVIVIGIFGVGINIPFFFFGLRLAPAINAPIIASSGPILLLIISMLFLGEKPKIKVTIGTLVSLGGVLIIMLQPLFKDGFDLAVLGNLYFLVAALGAVIHVIVSKKLKYNYAAETLTFWSFAIGSLIFLPFFIKEFNSYNFLNTLNFQGFIGIVYGVIFSSTLAYLLYMKGIQKIKTMEIGIFSYIDPVMAVVVAWFLLGETVNLTFIIGSVMVLSGIFLAEGRFHYHPIHLFFKNHD